MDKELKDRLLAGSGDFADSESHSFKDYLKLIRNNWVPVVLITIACLAVAVFYASYAVDIYKSTATMRLARPQGGSVLTSPLMPSSVIGEMTGSLLMMEIKSFQHGKVANALLDVL
jgi:uncharacterized protein involved in exopolysaccharide biosynthesis